MCQYCWEGHGAAYLAAHLQGESLQEAFDAPWTMAMLLQEGVPGLPPSASAVVTRRCMAMEARWRSDQASRSRSVIPEGHPFGAWRAPLDPRAVTPTERAEAIGLLWRYQKWASAAARLHIWRGTPADAALLLDAFPALWAAWLLLERAPATPEFVVLACALATGAAVLTDEMVELWLQRRAVLVWSETDGFDALLDVYGTKLRPLLAHYAALRHPPSSTQRRRLTELAIRHGETEALGWSLA